MQYTYELFKTNPTQNNLDDIINKTIEIISNSEQDNKGTGITTTIAKSYSQYWLLADDNPILRCNKQLIDSHFNDILRDIDMIPKQLLSLDAKSIYINLVKEYAIKIKRVYKL
jgi:hypothetical protein